MLNQLFLKSFGKDLGVDTPETTAVYEALKPHAMGNAG